MFDSRAIQSYALRLTFYGYSTLWDMISLVDVLGYPHSKYNYAFQSTGC